MAASKPDKLTAPASTILIVDDEAGLRRVLSTVLEEDGHRILSADSGRAAVKLARNETEIDLVIADYLMPDLSGLETVTEIRKTHPGARILFLSGHATVRVAVEAMRLGAFDFLTKPFDIEAVRQTVCKAVAAPPMANRASDRKDRATDKPPVVTQNDYGFIGDAPASQKVKTELLRVATASATVLLLGETGTGKEVAAKLLHEGGARRGKPFVAVSCAALPESLLESELWGHEKNAFTGAEAFKPGRFELAHGGTLFLDEIGDIPMMTQVKLLRVLQEREFFRVGGTKAVRVDVRVVAATNRDLAQAVQEGTFRADLFYRLSIVPLTLPPLRHRREDIPALAQHFLSLCAHENRRGFPGGFDKAAMDVLSRHDWPGNIRELRNVVEYAVVLAPLNTDRIVRDALPPYLA